MRKDRPDDKDPDGATWNFPLGRSGTFTTRVKVNPNSRGGVIALADRFFDPSDATCDAKAMFLLPLDQLCRAGIREARSGIRA